MWISGRSIPESVIGCTEHSTLLGPHEIQQKRHEIPLKHTCSLTSVLIATGHRFSKQ